MAKQSSIQKNNHRKNIVSKFQNKRQYLKKKIMQKNLTMEDRFKIQSQLNDLRSETQRIEIDAKTDLLARRQIFQTAKQDIDGILLNKIDPKLVIYTFQREPILAYKMELNLQFDSKIIYIDAASNKDSSKYITIILRISP